MQLSFKSWNLVFAGVLLSLTLPASAQMACHQTHNAYRFQPYAEKGRVEKRALPSEDSVAIPASEPGKLMYAQSGGALFIKEKPLDEKTKKGVMELIRLWTYTQQTEFPKSIFGKNRQELILGLPLGNGHSIEITYRSSSANQNLKLDGPQTAMEPKFVAAEAILYGPGGVTYKVARLRDMNGNLRADRLVDLSDFPALADSQFLAHIPNEISGSVYEAFVKLEDRLGIMSKQELWDYSRQNAYYQMRFGMLKRGLKNLLSRNNWMEIGRKLNVTTLFVLPAAFLATIVGVKSISPEFYFDSHVRVKKAVAADAGMWINGALDSFRRSKAIANTDVKTQNMLQSQISSLIRDVEIAIQNDSVISPIATQVKMDKKAFAYSFALSKDEGIWVQRVHDPLTNRQITYIAFSKPDSTGATQYFPVLVDANRYKELINFLENQGDFTMPVAVGQ